MKPEDESPKPVDDPVEAPEPRVFDPHTELLLAADQDDSRVLRWSLIAAALLHVVLLLVTLPSLVRPSEPRQPGEKTVFVVQTLRFQPPPAPAQTTPPQPKAKKIPIPDPTPEDPEPIVLEEIEVPEIDFLATEADFFGIPDAPPAVEPGVPGGVMQVGDGVTAPVKIYGPQPQYSEEARQARIQGTVILQAVIDKVGAVTSVKVLKGLPLGLNDTALAAVKEWKYEPARLDGEPVPVYLSLLINFSLQ